MAAKPSKRDAGAFERLDARSETYASLLAVLSYNLDWTLCNFRLRLTALRLLRGGERPEAAPAEDDPAEACRWVGEPDRWGAAARREARQEAE